jgi:hypothetical protein
MTHPLDSERAHEYKHWKADAYCVRAFAGVIPVMDSPGRVGVFAALESYPMSASRSRNGVAPGKFPVMVVPVPEIGKIVEVQFFAQWDGILSHWKYGAGKDGKGKVVPCPGEDKCKGEFHRSNCAWRGFAPARVWHIEEGFWENCVFELTSFLAEQLRDRELRGETWRCERKIFAGEREKCWGELVASHPYDEVPEAFDVRPIVERTYNTPHIAWGQKPLFAPKMMAAPSFDSPPPGRRAGRVPQSVKEAEAAAEHRKVREVLDRAKAAGEIGGKP